MRALALILSRSWSWNVSQIWTDCIIDPLRLCCWLKLLLTAMLCLRLATFSITKWIPLMINNSSLPSHSSYAMHHLQWRRRPLLQHSIIPFGSTHIWLWCLQMSAIPLLKAGATRSTTIHARSFCQLNTSAKRCRGNRRLTWNPNYAHRNAITSARVMTLNVHIEILDRFWCIFVNGIWE